MADIGDIKKKIMEIMQDMDTTVPTVPGGNSMGYMSAPMNMGGDYDYDDSDMQQDELDTVTMDVPFMIRFMEVCREQVPDDNTLHTLAEKIIAASRDGHTLSTEDLLILGDEGGDTEECDCEDDRYGG